MKLRTLTFLLPFLLLGQVCASCEDNADQLLFCDVTLMPALPDGRTIVRMEVDTTLASTYLRNVNNRQNYEFPIFVNNRGTVRVQKGVYLISFDAEASFSDGTSARVRCFEYSNAERAVSLLGDTEAVVLNLTLIK